MLNNNNNNDNKYDEGLGTVYERIMLNNMFDILTSQYKLNHILEVPIYGMTGLEGINSVRFAQNGCNVTLCDYNKNLIKAQELWTILRRPINIIEVNNFKSIPLESKSFDLVWNFASLWHIKEAPALVHEMSRLSSNLVLVFVQNTHQPGFWIRKCFNMIPKDVNEEWLNMHLWESVLMQNGFNIIKKGYLDIPPFPDIAVSIGKKVKNDWNWNIINYYQEKDYELLNRLKKYEFLEKYQIPIWAHHKFILGQRV